MHAECQIVIDTAMPKAVFGYCEEEGSTKSKTHKGRVPLFIFYGARQVSAPPPQLATLGLVIILSSYCKTLSTQQVKELNLK